MYVGMVCLYGYLSLVNYCDMHVEREREARERFTRDLRREVKPAAVNHLLILERYMAVYSR